MAGRNLTVFLTSDTSKFGRGLRSAETRLSSFRQKAGQAVKIGAAAGAAAIAAGTAALVEAVKAGSDLNETLSKTDQIFKDSAQSIVDWSKDAAKTMGLSQKDALDTAATFGSIAKQAGMSEKGAARYARNLASLASDLASFWNVDVTEAAASLASGLRGESEPLKKFSIDVSQAAVKQEALTDGTLKLGKAMDGTSAKLTKQQQLQATTNKIFRDAQDAVGDFGRTADGLANSSRTISSAWDDIVANFGEGFLDGFTGVEGGVNDVRDSMVAAADDAAAVGKAFGDGLETAVGSIMPLMARIRAVFLNLTILQLQLQRSWNDFEDKIGVVSDEIGDIIRKNLDQQIRDVQTVQNTLVATNNASENPYDAYRPNVNRTPQSRPVLIGGGAYDPYASQNRPKSVDPARYQQRATDTAARARARGVRTRANP